MTLQVTFEADAPSLGVVGGLFLLDRDLKAQVLEQAAIGRDGLALDGRCQLFGRETDRQTTDSVLFLVDVHHQVKDIGPFKLLHQEDKAGRSGETARNRHFNPAVQALGKISQTHAIERFVGIVTPEKHAVMAATGVFDNHGSLSQRVVEGRLDQERLIGAGPSNAPLFEGLSPHQQLARGRIGSVQHRHRDLAQRGASQGAGKAQVQGLSAGRKCAIAAHGRGLRADLDIAFAKPRIEGRLNTVGVGICIARKLQHLAVGLGQQVAGARQRGVAQGVAAAGGLAAL